MMKKPYLFFELPLILISIFGFSVILLATSPYGIGISPDSVSYIQCARSILAGKGLVDIYDKPFVTWPPLFPVILAFGVKIGFNIFNFSRFFNAFVFGLLIYFSGKLFRQYIISACLALFGALIVLSSITFLIISTMLWSDGFFVLISILFLYFLNRYSLQQKGYYLYFAALCAALACLQRYAGVALIFAGSIFSLFFPLNASLPKKIQNTFIFGFTASFPLAILLIHNFSVSGTVTGVRAEAAFSLRHYIIETINCLMIYFIHPDINFSVSSMILVGFFALFTAAIIYHRSGSNKVNETSASLLFLAFFILINIGFIVYLSVNTKLDPVLYRYLAVVNTPVVALALTGIDCLKKLLDEIIDKKALSRAFVVILCLGWLQSPVYLSIENIHHMMSFGAGIYNNREWRESQFIKFLKHHPLNGNVFSNAPDAVYILCNIKVQMMPYHTENLKNFSHELSENHDNYLIWFKGIGFRPYLLSIDELAATYKINRVKEFEDGSLYKIFLAGQ